MKKREIRSKILSRKQHSIFEGRYAIYLYFEVDFPKIPGKINYVKRGRVLYASDMCERVYHPEKNIMFQSRGSLKKA